MTNAVEKQTAGLVKSPAAVNCFRFETLESLLKPNVPEPTLDRGQRFVVAVLEVAGHKRWVFVGHVLHTESNCGVIKPPFPVAAAVLSRGNRDDILLLAVLHFHVLAAILGIPRDLCWCRRREVERIV